MQFYEMTLDEGQEKLVKTIMSKDTQIVFCNARAGTGKTTIAFGVANLIVQDKRNPINGIIYIVSPYGEQKQGYLPGSVTEKSEVYFEPAYQAMIEIGMNPNSDIIKESLIEKKKNGDAYVKLLTHTFLRGSNLSKKVIIIDEAQNFTVPELKKVLTRIHDDSKVLVMGHTGQIDIDARSGFEPYLEYFRNYENGAICELTENHRGKLSSFADALEE